MRADHGIAMLTAKSWKQFYADEREQLGENGIDALLDRAATIAFPPGRALIFPHTRLETSGHLVAAVANAIVASGAEEVLALGVLHGAREQDAERVKAARAGDAAATEALRGLHGPGVSGDGGFWAEEFSLDNLKVLLDAATRRTGKPPPRVIERYPFLVGATPETLPGIDELRDVVKRGAILVATTDPAHHGVGYGTPADECLPREQES